MDITPLWTTDEPFHSTEFDLSANKLSHWLITLRWRPILFAGNTREDVRWRLFPRIPEHPIHDRWLLTGYGLKNVEMFLGCDEINKCKFTGRLPNGCLLKMKIKRHQMKVVASMYLITSRRHIHIEDVQIYPTCRAFFDDKGIAGNSIQSTPNSWSSGSNSSGIDEGVRKRLMGLQESSV